jgi:tellurite resistance protein
MDPSRLVAPPFPAEGKRDREELRRQLHESACDLRIDRLEHESGQSMIARYGLTERIRDLGFDGEAQEVFDLLPLVHVAWADGSVAKRERAAVLGLVVRRVGNEGKAWRLMVSLLEERPSDEYLEESLAVLREMLGGEPDRAKSVVDACVGVAKAAGGFLRVFHRISKEETEIISRIAESLGPAGRAQLKLHQV